MVLSEETLWNIINKAVRGWSEVAGTQRPVDQSRWLTTWRAVFSHAESGKSFEITWNWPSTEMPVGEKMATPTYCEVEQKEVTETKWVPVATA